MSKNYMPKRYCNNESLKNIPITNAPVKTFYHEANIIHATGKHTINAAFQEKNPLTNHRDQISLKNTNKMMKNCESSPNQKLDKIKMRVTFNAEETRKRLECPDVGTKIERLTKSQSNIKPDVSHKTRTHYRTKKTSSRTTNLQFQKKTSSLTNFDKVLHFKKLHKLYTEGELNKETITKEAIALIQAINQNPTGIYSNDIPKPSVTTMPANMSKENSQSSILNGMKSILGGMKQRKVIKTSEKKYDAVILNNICVMGKKLSLWKRIKQRFNSSTTTKADDRSNETISSEIRKKDIKAIKSKESCKTSAFKSYNPSYFCYPASCGRNDIEWNITKVQTNKKKFECPKPQRSPAKRCNELPQLVERIPVKNCMGQIEGYEIPNPNACHTDKIKHKKRGCHDEEDCATGGNRLWHGEECYKEKNTGDTGCSKHGNMAEDYEDKNVCRECHKRSIRTQVTVKNDQKCKIHSKPPCPCEGVNRRIQTGHGHRHHRHLGDMSGDAPRLVIKHSAHTDNPIIKYINDPAIRHCNDEKCAASQTPKDNMLCDQCNNQMYFKKKYYQYKHAYKWKDRSRSRSKSKTRSQSKRRSRSKKRWHSKSRPDSHSKSKSRSRSKKRPHSKSRSRSRSHSRSTSHSRSKSRSRSESSSRKGKKKKYKAQRKSSSHEKFIKKKSKKKYKNLKNKHKKHKNIDEHHHKKMKPSIKLQVRKRKKAKKKKKKKTDKHKDGYHVYDCDELYMNSLRRTPWRCVYYICPTFYPHCISCLGIVRQATRLCLIIMAMVLWSPCLCCIELCRALMCNMLACSCNN